MKVFPVVLAALGLVAFIGCAKKPDAKIIEAGQTYYFYPKANVYYDTTAGNYIFLGEDENWQTNTKLPANKQSLLEKNILINNPELPVWKNNDAHQMLYSAALYSIKADFKEETKTAITNKKDVVEEKEQEKEKDNKTGVGKFFNKIFKGKKDKQEEVKDTNKSETTKS